MQIADRVKEKFRDGGRWLRNHCPYMEGIYNVAIGILGLLIIFAVPLSFLYGYIANIVTLFHLETIMSGEGAIRIAGIFLVPVGWIAGYF